MAELIGIQSHQIDLAWPSIEGLVLKALNRTGSISDYDPEDLKELCKRREMQCWVACDKAISAVCLTRILIFPKRKVFSLFLCGAEDNSFNDWWHFHETLKAYGKEKGCSAIRLGGRRGWIRKFGAKSATTLFTVGI
ncbi:MAG: hypothetical protein GY942_20100 [Aestuariibacter sp.]|nr:hypothetical protein [Aestuariibacter sp.]